LKLVRADSASWRLDPLPDATAEQLRMRAGWLTGHVDLAH